MRRVKKHRPIPVRHFELRNRAGMNMDLYSTYKAISCHLKVNHEVGLTMI